MDRARDADPARFGQRFEPRRDVDAIAQNVAILGDHVAEIDADAIADAPVVVEIPLAVEHAALHLGGAAHRIDDAGEFRQQPVAGGLDDAALMFADFGVDPVAAMRPEAIEGPFLIGPDQTRIARYVSGKYRRQTADRSHHSVSPARSVGSASTYIQYALQVASRRRRATRGDRLPSIHDCVILPTTSRRCGSSRRAATRRSRR